MTTFQDFSAAKMRKGVPVGVARKPIFMPHSRIPAN